MLSISPDQQTEEIDHYLFLLQDLVWTILEGHESLPSLKKRFGELFIVGYPESLQLPKAYLALIFHLLNFDSPSVYPEQFPNGTALLDTLGWCESREIPEPIELAQLGVLWMILGIRLKNEALQRAGLKVALWHVHLLDSQGRSHVSAWSRARSFRLSTFSLWKSVLFTIAYRLTGERGFNQLAEVAKGEAWDPKALAVKLLVLVPSKLSQSLHHPLRPFAEEMTVGIIKFSTPEMSMMAHLSGWNSGLFSFHKKEVALINAGPQVGSYDHLDQFGIRRTWGTKERPFQEMIWEKTAYHSHLKGWTRLLSHPLWLEFDARLQAGQATFEVGLQEKQVDTPVSMVLYLQSPKLIIGGKYHLEAGSLEGHQGKAVPLELQGAQEKMVLHPDPALYMQVIPLAGGEHFWGAHFLVAFPLGRAKPFRVEVK